jgi:hypothetical protein
LAVGMQARATNGRIGRRLKQAQLLLAAWPFP